LIAPVSQESSTVPARGTAILAVLARAQARLPTASGSIWLVEQLQGSHFKSQNGPAVCHSKLTEAIRRN